MSSFLKACLLLLAAPLLMGAEVYRWVDGDGVVNYGQRVPEGVVAERVSASTGQRIVTTAPARGGQVAAGQTATEPGPIDAPADQQLTPEQQKMLDDLRAAEQVRQQELARIREANCQQARTLLDQLTSRGRLRVRGDDGVERVLPEDERQRRIEEAQRGIAVNCAESAAL
jgi:hypothetical protein